MLARVWPMPSAPTLPCLGRSIAVVIGINAYSRGLQPLQNALRDANAIGDALRRQGFEVLRLLDSEASLSSLSHLFSHHLPSLEPAPDRLLIYFAGHGLAHTDAQHNLSGFLLPADARRDDLSSYWPMDSVREALGRLRCGHLLIILDCCFAGAFPRSAYRDISPLEEPAPPLFLERFRHLTSRRSFQALLSTAHDELASDKLLARPSQESLGDGLHSPFAHALLEALKQPSAADFNQDGLITASELFVFLSNRLVPSPGYQQTPSLWNLDWHDHGEFIFLLGGTFPQLPSAAPLSKESNPYLGLRPFSAEHRHRFFGRERQVDTLVRRICSEQLLLLCAPSGAGKSSLVHAGLLPRLSDSGSWLIPASLRPSSSPLQALSSWLANLSSDVLSDEELTSQPHLAAGLVKDFLSCHPERSVLLVIDPLEELVTTCLDDTSRLAFLNILASLLLPSLPRFHVLLLLRSDFEPHFLPLLQTACFPSSFWQDARCALPPMNRDDLRRCIEKPVESCVLFFSRGMVDRILDDVEQMPGALPLLSVALRELFEAYIESGRGDRTLADGDYERIGGIAGALQRRAESIFSGVLSDSSGGQTGAHHVPAEELPAYQRTLSNVLLRMVSPEGSEPARRRLPLSELDYAQSEDNERVQSVLAALAASRLIVVQTSGDVGRCVEPSHDFLLTAWARLHGWARHAQQRLQVLRRISAAAQEWKRQKHSSDFLWGDTRLEQLGLAQESLRRAELPLLLPISTTGSPIEPLLLNALESDFLRASAARQRSRVKRRNSIALATAVSLIFLAVLAVLLFLAAERERKASLASERVAAAQKLLNEDPTTAHLVLSEVIEPEHQTTNWLQAAMDVSRRPVSSAILRAGREQLRGASFSPQGKHVLTTFTEGTMLLWRADGRARPLVIGDATGDTPGRAAHASFSPDGSWVIAGYADGTVRLWPVAEGHHPVELGRHQGNVSITAFSPTGALALTGVESGAVRIWRVAGSGRVSEIESEAVLDAQAGTLLKAMFSPDEEWVLMATDKGTVHFRHVSGKSARPPLEGPASKVKSMAFTRGHYLLVTHDDGSARLWDLREPATSSSLDTYVGPVEAAAFSPEGSSLLTLTTGGSVHLWRVEGTLPPLPVEGSERVRLATFSPEGLRILVVATDGSARIWSVGEQKYIFNKIGREGEVTSASFSHDGSLILMAFADGVAYVQRVDGGGSPRLLVGHQKMAGRRALKSASFDADDKRILTVSEDDTARLWDLRGLAPRALERQLLGVDSSTVSPDGSCLLTVTHAGAISLWCASSGNPAVTLEGVAGRVTFATFSADGTLVFAATDDRVGHLWHAQDGRRLATLAGHMAPIYHASFNQSSSRLLTASLDGTVRLWHTDSSGRSSMLAAHGGPATFAEFSPDGSKVVTLSNEACVHLLSELEKPEPHCVLHQEVGRIGQVKFSHDGAYLATVSEDAVVRVWRVDGRGSLDIALVGEGLPDSVSFSPDSSRILSVTSRGLALLQWVDGRSPPVSLEHSGAEVTAAIFSPDGVHVLTTARDRTVRLWRVDRAATLLTTLTGHERPVRQAMFLPSERRALRIVTSAGGDSARLWWAAADGSVSSVALVHDGLSAAFPLSGGSHLATQAGDELLVWPITPTSMLESMRQATAVCLSASERERLLGEPLREATTGFIRCEQSRGRQVHSP